MKIIFTTNLDAYGPSMFPELHHFVPRVGELVETKRICWQSLEDKKLPRRLEVVRVIHREEVVVVELWYNATDKKIADLAGAKTME